MTRATLCHARSRMALWVGGSRAKVWGENVRKIAAHQITASDFNTFPDNMRMKFVMTTT